MQTSPIGGSRYETYPQNCGAGGGCAAGSQFDGLLAEYTKTFPEGAVIVKGLRANTDFENEFQMALINQKINPELDTMFLTASQKYTFLSSSVVKELAGYGADLTPFVPCEIIEDVRARAMRSE